MPTNTEKDACELLDADHLAVKHLFVDYARLALAPENENTTTERTKIAMQICDELTVHSKIEEEIFYPALRAVVPDAGQILDEAEADHDEVKQFIAKIRKISNAGSEMDEIVAKMNVAVECHVKEERDILFPKAKASVGLNLISLGEKLHARQLALKINKKG